MNQSSKSQLRIAKHNIASSYQSRTLTVEGKVVPSSDTVTLNLTFTRILGKGTFGCIEQAKLNNSETTVAVKRVFQDPRYKNRELSTLLRLGPHTNLIKVLYYFYTSSNNSSSNRNTSNNDAGGNNANEAANGNVSTGGDLYLQLVMECFPESLADLINRYVRRYTKIKMRNIELYSYQMMRALGFIHLQNICHRDIKSSNLLVNEKNGMIKLCDFGSAKEIVSDQANVAYISSRYYRAPELIFGAEYYNCAIDIWSAGCVIAELLSLKCLFMGGDSIDQLAEIIKVLGTPSPTDVKAMNPKYTSNNFPRVPYCPLKLYLPMETPQGLVKLLSQMLVYNPNQRIVPLKALNHEAFVGLYSPGKDTDGSYCVNPDIIGNFQKAEIDAEPLLDELNSKINQAAVEHKMKEENIKDCNGDLKK